MRRATMAFVGLMSLAVAGFGARATAAGFTAPGPGDWRPADAENTLVIDTNQGRIIVELVPASAPKTVAQIKALARQHFYDGLTFFRVIDDFMDQTGDPKNTGEGGSSLPNVPAEFSFRRGPADGMTVVERPPGLEFGFIGALPVASQPIAQSMMTADGKVTAGGLFCPGVIGMARANDPDSGNSQFFLMRASHDALNGRYTAFGRVLVGQDVVKKIKTGEPVPAPQDKMLKVQVLADMPAGQRPNVRVIDTKSAYFAALAAQAKAAAGDTYSICDVEVAGEAK
ncbi:peptidylprolyl isomerase [Phenylobacterium montanum]|nr:peptidylprolyl isomerase [Caulobacter sp. S6]